MRYALSAGFIRDYVEHVGLRADFGAHSLPTTEEFAKVRAAVDKAYDQVDLLLVDYHERLVTLNDAMNVNVSDDGELSYRNGWGGIYLHIDNIYLTVEDCVAEINAELPSWAHTVFDSDNRLMSIKAKPQQSEMRQAIIPQIVRNNRDADMYGPGLQSEIRYTTTASNDRYGKPIGDYVKPQSAAKLVKLAKQIKTDHVGVLRALFHGGSRNGSEVPVPTHDTSASFLNFMNERSRKMRDARDGTQHIPTLPTLPHGSKVNLTWGIEVESAGARGVSAPSGWDRKYDSSLHSAYGDGNYGGGQYHDVDPSDCYYSDQHREEEQIENEDWFEDREIDNPDYDPALAATDPDYDEPELITEECGEDEYIDNPDWIDADDCESCGEDIYDEDYDEDSDENNDCAEFVSPILRSYHSRGLEKLVAELIEQPQNDSAGVHVHVGAEHLTPRQIGTLLIGYQFIEGLVEESYNRETREYCKERPNSELMSINGYAKKATKTRVENRYDTFSRQGVMEYGDRYVALNICSLHTHGTVEFRAMGPVYSYAHLIRWAMFCREMVASVGNGAKTKDFMAVNTWDDLTALFAKFGNEYAAASIVKLENRVMTEQEALAEV